MLPKPKKSKKGEIVDPFVVVKLKLPDNVHRGPSEKFKTKVIDDNGFNPEWNSNVVSPTYFCFKDKIVMPELSFLTLSVRDKDLLTDDSIAGAVIPCDCLREGYRLVSLYDYQGSKLPFANLFVSLRIDKAN